MIKNNKGVTLTALVVTIIVIIILASIVITASNDLIKDTKAKNVLSNMYLIKGKMETIYEDYQFSNNPSILAPSGIQKVNVSSLAEYGVTSDGLSSEETADEFWYQWDQTDIEAFGFDKNMLPNENAKYDVNYKSGEIVYTPGIKNDSGEKIYTFTEISDYLRGN